MGPLGSLTLWYLNITETTQCCRYGIMWNIKGFLLACWQTNCADGLQTGQFVDEKGHTNKRPEVSGKRPAASGC